VKRPTLSFNAAPGLLTLLLAWSLGACGDGAPVSSAGRGNDPAIAGAATSAMPSAGSMGSAGSP